MKVHDIDIVIRGIAVRYPQGYVRERRRNGTDRFLAPVWR
jgi:hypothetical protein